MEHRPHSATDPTAKAIARLRRRLQGAQRRATTVALAAHTRTVDAALAAGTRPDRRYWGDCYRRAAEYVLAHARPRGPCHPQTGMKLVHGTCRTGGALWAHAWVELPGAVVFCGVRQRFYDRDGFYLVLGATAEAVYRPGAAVARLRATSRYGPWHRGALGGAAARRLPVLGGGSPPAALVSPEARA
jgi:hypothetical protein